MKKITVQSGNHKYQAVLRDTVVTITRTAGNYTGKWEKVESPRPYYFTMDQALEHNSKRFHFVLKSGTPDRNGMCTMHDSINNDAFALIQRKFK